MATVSRRNIVLAQLQGSSDRLVAVLEMERYNSFAAVYNHYIEKLSAGVLDMKLRQRVRKKACEALDLQIPKGG